MSTPSQKIVAVIGLGYVGLPIAVLAKSKGWQVFGIDIDSDKVYSINELAEKVKSISENKGIKTTIQKIKT